MTTIRLETASSSRWYGDGTTLLTILLCFSLLVPSRYVVPALGGVGRPDVLLGVGLLAWWLVSLTVPRLTYRARNPLRWACALWILSIALALVAAYARPLSVLERSGTERSTIGVLSNIGLILICAEGIRSRERLETLLKRLTYLGGAVAFIGSLQFFVGLDVSPYLVPPGLGLNNDLYGVGTRSIFNRVSGTSIHAIEYGAVLALILPLACHFAIHAKTRAESHWRWALAGLIGLAGLYSVSRTNTIAVAVIMVLLIALWTGRMRLNALVAGTAALVAVHAVIPGLLGTIKSLFQNLDNDPSIEGRTSDYPIAFEYISERPFFGRGPGTFNAEEYFVLDNHWLGTLVQMGWFGVLAAAVMIALPFVMARHLLNTAKDNEWRHLAGVLAAQLVVIATVSFFFDAGGFPQFRSVQMLLVGAVGAMWAIGLREDPHDFRPGARADVLKATKHRDSRRHPAGERPPLVLDVPAGAGDTSR